MKPEFDIEPKGSEASPGTPSFIPNKVDSDKSVESFQPPVPKKTGEFSFKIKFSGDGEEKITLKAPEKDPFAFDDYNYDGLLSDIRRVPSDQGKAEELPLPVPQEVYSPWDSIIKFSKEEVQSKFT